jgi:hypothetical protein
MLAAQIGRFNGDGVLVLLELASHQEAIEIQTGWRLSETPVALMVTVEMCERASNQLSPSAAALRFGSIGKLHAKGNASRLRASASRQ